MPRRTDAVGCRPYNHACFGPALTGGLLLARYRPRLTVVNDWLSLALVPSGALAQDTTTGTVTTSPAAVDAAGNQPRNPSTTEGGNHQAASFARRQRWTMQAKCRKCDGDLERPAATVWRRRSRSVISDPLPDIQDAEHGRGDSADAKDIE